MPQTKAAAKAVRADKKRRVKNDRWRRQVRDSVRTARDAVKAQDKSAAAKAVSQAASILDKAARHHIIHRNKAARRKAQLASALAKLK